MKLCSPSSRYIIAALFILLPFAGHSQSSPSAQQSNTDAQSQTVLRATTNLVVVDIVAGDDKGHALNDLKAGDFTVLEDGKPQQIIDFSFQRPTAKARPPLQLPVNVVSNAPEYVAVSSLNVVLLDAVNTDFSAHAYAQEMLIRYLESGPAIQPTAVYALDGRLTLLHDFTTDTQALRDAIAHFKPQGPTHIQTTEAMASPFSQRGSFQAGPHAREITFNAMRFLAHALAGYRGRKNLIWLSEDFPLNLYPDTLLSDGTMIVEDYRPAVEKIADELMKAQVAIYPIDAAGVTKDDRFSARTSMLSMSERTGGKTFYNRNDIDLGIRTSLDDGSTYYSLAYYPQNREWNGKFRNIEVKVNRPGARLQYRRGYYALTPAVTASESDKSLATDFSTALVLGAPSTAGVLFQAMVVPPSEETQNRYVVNFGVDPHTVAFEQMADGRRRAAILCAVWAYPSKGDPIRSDGNTLNARLSSEEYDRMMKSYFPCQRPLELKRGEYTLRLGVLDRTTNLIGTTTMKLTVP